MINLSSRIISYLISVNLHNPVINSEHLTSLLIDKGFQKKSYQTGFLISKDQNIQINKISTPNEISKHLEPYNMVGNYSIIPFLHNTDKEINICYNFGHNGTNSNLVDGIIKDLNTLQDLFLNKIEHNDKNVHYYRLEVLLSVITNKDFFKEVISNYDQIKDLFKDFKIYKINDALYIYPNYVDVDIQVTGQPMITNIEQKKPRKEKINTSDWTEMVLKSVNGEHSIKFEYRCNNFEDIVTIFKNIEVKSLEIVKQIESNM